MALKAPIVFRAMLNPVEAEQLFAVIDPVEGAVAANAQFAQAA